MDLSVTFLGTGGSVPSARRSTASVLISRGGERLLFDCGEGTQRQMQRSLGLVQLDEIYMTHFHADHTLGLPGLLKTYDLTDREPPLTVYGPPGLRDLFEVMKPLIGRLCFEVRLVELEPGQAVPHDGYEIQPFEAAHSVRANGYALVEEERPGKFVVEASFAEEEAQRAAETGHSTVGQAAAVAREAHVKLLALVHISSRYHVGKVLEEAEDVYEATVAPKDFDVIEIPFPERGYPELVPNGARETRE